MLFYPIIFLAVFTVSCGKTSVEKQIAEPSAVAQNTYTNSSNPALHPKLILGGNCSLRSSNKTLVITSDLSFPDNDDDTLKYHWKVPISIDTIIIKESVTLTGGFKIQSNDDIVIKGEDPNLSVLYGTKTKDWAKGRIAGSSKPHYSAITEEKGATGINARVENLKIENARVYALTFRNNNKLTALRVYILNSRGVDYGSNSDGIVAGSGSVIDDCYIDTWDDAVKLYYDDITVKNTTIVHNKNGAPFQLGWGSKPALSATVENVRVKDAIGNSISNQALFCYGGSTGTCAITVNVTKLAAPDYSLSAMMNMNGGLKKPLPLVSFKSTTNGCSFKMVGKSSNDFKGSAAAAWQNNAGATVKVDKICGNGLNVDLANSYSCASAGGCSWKN